MLLLFVTIGDSLGNMYISDGGAHVIRKLNSTGYEFILAGSYGVSSSTATSSNGDSGPATAATLNQPYQIVLDSSGNLYVADYGNRKVRRVSATGIISTYAGSGNVGTPSNMGDNGPARSASFSQVKALAIDSNANIYVSDAGLCSIRRISATGLISTIAGIAGSCSTSQATSGIATSTSLNQPGGLFVDTDSNSLYLVELLANYVRRLTLSSGILTVIAGSGGANTVAGGDGPATSAQFNGLFGIWGKLYWLKICIDDNH